MIIYIYRERIIFNCNDYIYIYREREREDKPYPK